MHTLIKFASLLVLFFAASAFADCSSCGQGLQCCADQCYDATKASCERGSSNQEVLCGFQHLPAQTPDAVCGSACYDTVTYGCCNATNTIYGLGSEAANFCPTMTTPVDDKCDSGTPCATGLSCCNNQCYNTSTAGCETSSTGQLVLCGFQHLPAQIHDAACGSICYDLLYYGCCNATGAIYDLNMMSTLCAGSPTSAPTNGPTSTASPTNSPTSGPSTCGGVTCGAGLSCCAGKCYNPQEAGCELSNRGYQVLCGFQHLPEQIHDAACGDYCYDLLYYRCCNSSSVIVQIGQEGLCAQTSELVACGTDSCVSGFGCCGASCYDVTRFNCVANSNNQQMICNSGDMSCGLYCYNPSTGVCCNNQIYGRGDVNLPASCGGVANGNFAGNYNGYNGNGGYYYDSNGVFQNCDNNNNNSASMMLVSGFAIVLSVLAAML